MFSWLAEPLVVRSGLALGGAYLLVLRGWASWYQRRAPVKVGTRIAGANVLAFAALAPLLLLLLFATVAPERFALVPLAMLSLRPEVAGLSVLVGGILGVCGLAILTWAHLTLGTHFSMDVQLKERHRLVQEGPYR